MDNLWSGVFGLLGVVIGALGTTWTQVFLDRRRERREGDRAKLLVTGELLQAQRILMAIARYKVWPDTDPDFMLPTSAWREGRYRLAGHVDEDTFNRIVMVYSVIEIDRGRFETAGAGSAAMTDSEIETMKKNAKEIGELRRSMGARGDWPDYPEDFDKAGSA